MDEKTTALFEKLAKELGTTAEHLWGVLLRQAPISGTVDLVLGMVLVAVGVGLLLFVNGKTTKPALTEVNRFPEAQWRCEGAVLAWVGVALYWFITGLGVFGYTKDVIAAFLNPEYWALAQILDKF